jgi:YD repeat-containing protein
MVGGVWHVREKGSNLQQYFSLAGAGVSNSIAPLRFSQSIFGLQLEFEHNTSNGPNDWRPVPEVASVKDSFGRTLTFEFENPSDIRQLRRVKLIKDMAGRLIQFKYNGDGMLSDIVWPDGTSRQFRYEVKDQPWLLTSWIDEAGAVVGRYSYDAQGRAISTQEGAGTNSHRIKRWATEPTPIIKRWYDPVEGVIWREVAWTNPQEVEVEGPSGQSSVISTVMVNQMPRLASQSQPAGAGCAAAVREQRYDGNGNVISRTDFTGRRSCTAYDLSRNLESSRIEGLNATVDCDTQLRSETLPKDARRVSTAWHPVWNLPVRTAEPGRIVTKVYNGQPDPFDAGRIASCAGYYGAYLVDNSPMVLLCKQVEQATTDLDGSKGFSATPQTGVSATRTWQFTYDPYGRIQTAKDPLGNVTSNEYYLGSNADVTVGDLKSTTNALGQVVSYTKYSPSGMLLRSVDQNGLLTTYTYDLRDRVTSITVGDRTTTISYWPTGLMKQVTQADGSVLNYAYDDAHRLVAVSDGLGNRIDYTLDGAGNKTAETVNDASGRLARQVSRVMDALGRVQQVSGRE